MKSYENSPVNEWNSTADKVAPTTLWPWDIWVTRSRDGAEAGAAKELTAKAEPAEAIAPRSRRRVSSTSTL